MINLRKLNLFFIVLFVLFSTCKPMEERKVSDYFKKKLMEIRNERQKQAKSLLQQSELALDMRNYNDAIRFALKAIAEKPKPTEEVELYYLLSQASLQLGEFDEAIKAAGSGLDINFRHNGLLLVLCEAYFKQGKPKDALESAKEALDWIPVNSAEAVRLYVLFNKIYFELGQRDKAKAFSKNALQAFKEYLTLKNKKFDNDEFFDGINPEHISSDLVLVALGIVSKLKLMVFMPNLIGQISHDLVNHIVNICIKGMLKTGFKKEVIKETVLEVLADLTYKNEVIPIQDEWARQFAQESKRINRNIDDMIYFAITGKQPEIVKYPEVGEYSVGEDENTSPIIVQDDNQREIVDNVANPEQKEKIIKIQPKKKTEKFDLGGWEDISEAAKKGNLDAFKFFVEDKKMDPNAISPYSHSNIPTWQYAIFGGHLEIVKYLVKEKKINLNVAPKSGSRPLLCATQAGYLKIVKYLIENGSNLNVKEDRYSPLQHAIIFGKPESRHWEVVKYLVEEVKVDINSAFQDSLFYQAVNKGQLEIVKFLIEENKMDPNVKDKNGDTPLHLAARTNHLEIVKYLIENGADLNIKNNAGKTPIGSCRGKGLGYINWFLANKKAGLEKEKAQREKELEKEKYIMREYRDIFEAIKKSNLNALRFFIEKKKVVPDVKNNHGDTLLHLATYGGHMEIIKYLVEEKKVALDVKDRNGKTSFDVAVFRGNLGVAKYLKGYLTKQKEKEKEKARLRKERIRLEEEKRNMGGCRNIFDASKRGNLHALKFFIEKKNVSPDIKNKNGDTPLHYAAGSGHLEITKYLMKKGADPEIENNRGEAPYHVAKRTGYRNLAKYLKTTMLDAKGYCNIFEALEEGSLKAVRFFIEIRKVDPNISNKNSRTPIMLAIHNGHMEIVRYLVEKCKFCHTDPVKCLQIACNYAHFKLVKYFIEEREWDPNIIGPHQMTLLHWASWCQGSTVKESEVLKIVKYLVEEKKLNPNAIDGQKSTPIGLLAKNQHFKAVRYLLEKGADPNVYSSKCYGKSPLYHAVYYKDLETVKCLVENGADLTYKNSSGKTLVQTATEKGLGINYHWSGREGHINQVIVNYLRGIKNNPKDVLLAHYEHGNIHYSWRNYDKAFDSFTKVIELDPKDLKSELARTMIKKIKIEQAARIPYGQGNAYWCKGTTARNKSQGFLEKKFYEKAIPHYTKAIEIGTEYGRIYQERGYCYKGMGEYDKAIADFSKTMECNIQSNAKSTKETCLKEIKELKEKLRKK